MNKIIDFAFSRFRSILFIFAFIILAGAICYRIMPKEAAPDVPIPIILVQVSYEGISPEDGERLLLKPLEKELQGLEGLKEIRAYAVEGFVNATLEFYAGFDNKVALQDVREKVDMAKSQFPDGSDEPFVKEINVALFPILTVNLSGNVDESTLINLAKDLKDKIETIPSVLEAEIVGDREELIEVILDPMVMETYKVSYGDVVMSLQKNNRLVAAGAIDTGQGRLVLKIPAVLETVEDVMNYPIKTVGNRILTFRDVANIRRSYKDPTSIARLNAQPTIALEVSKRIGANIIWTVDAVREIIDNESASWQDKIHVYYSQDSSEHIKEMLSDLQNNVISAVLLVMLVIVAALGLRSSVIVGLAIPSSFLAGILILYFSGCTLNIVVLFSLILVVGMLVDGAIIVAELADRYQQAGYGSFKAYAMAAKRMSWPVIASTATTLAVFVPLLFWPGVIGKFMKFLPMTVLFTLGSSLFMALIFLPVIGGLIDRKRFSKGGNREIGDLPPEPASGWMYDIYIKILKPLLNHPVKSLIGAILITVGIYALYAKFNHGVEFFPSVEPDYAQVHIRARGDLSIYEKDALVRQIENELNQMDEIESVYAHTLGQSSWESMPEDVVGVVQLEFEDWQQRRPVEEIFEDIRTKLKPYAGLIIELHEQEHGPSQGKPIVLRLFSPDQKKLEVAVNKLENTMEEIAGFEDVENTLPLPGIEWRLEVDRKKASRLGADTSLLGNMVQVLTKGFTVTSYRPDDVDDEVDINIRFPKVNRNLNSVRRLRVLSDNGFVPVENFVDFVPKVRRSSIRRIDGNRTATVKAGVRNDLLPDTQMTLLKKALLDDPLDGVEISFKGQDEDQREAATFLANAFIVALFLMMLILLLQFNSFYQMLLVLSAIIFSTSGVLLGLLVTFHPLGIVMVGIALIALSGIVINNNIVLIDLYNQLIGEGMNAYDAVINTCRQRLRPIFLTAVTTVLGLIPMTLALNIDFIAREVTLGAPSTQWWSQLSTAIVFGLSVATFVTLLVTPVLLILKDGRKKN